MEPRELILQNAIQLFTTKGYEATGVQEIVAASGITKPTLYHHFGSKRGLLEALAAPVFNRLNRAVRDAAVYEHDLGKNLQEVLTIFCSFAGDKPVFSRLMLTMIHAPGESEAREVVFPFLEQQYRDLEQLFLEAAEDHGNMRGRSETFAATFLGMIHTYISLYLNGHITLDERIRHEAYRQFSHGIYS